MNDFRDQARTIFLTRDELHILYDIADKLGVDRDEAIGKALRVYKNLREFVDGKQIVGLVYEEV